MPHPLGYGQHSSHRLPKRLVLVAVVAMGCYALVYSARTAVRVVNWMRLCSTWETCSVAQDAIVAEAVPAKYAAISNRIVPLKGFIPASRRTFVPQADSPWVGTGLLHALKSPAGHKRTVCIDVTAFDKIEAGTTNRVIFLIWGVYELDHRSIHNLWTSRFYLDIPPDAQFRLYGATIDPKDSSHFQMKYEYMNRTGIINGYLMDDESVRIVPDVGTGGGPPPQEGWRPAGPSS